MAKVLLFQCKNEDKIRAALASMKISAVSVPEDCFHLTLGEIERGENLSACSVQDVSKEIISAHFVRKAPEEILPAPSVQNVPEEILSARFTEDVSEDDAGEEEKGAERFSQESKAERHMVTESGRRKAVGQFPRESMVVMCDFTEKQMNRFLEKLKKEFLPVDYKAVLTAANRGWNVRRMYFEMARERAMYLQMERKRQ